MRYRPLLPIVLLLPLAGACSKAAPDNVAAAAPSPDAKTALPDTPPPAPRPQDTSDPQRFVPIQSQAVQDAIHRALRTGQTQRWQDGALGGYAVPSPTPGANGCRAVRYTVDQRPGTPFESITACEGSR